MNIKEFKVGDLVTRNEPMRYAHNGSADSSWCGDRMVLLGLDETAKIIFLKLEKKFGDEEEEPYSMSYARDAWDEGWTLYPETTFQKIKQALKPTKL